MEVQLLSSKLKIELETESDEDLYNLLQHVCNEITRWPSYTNSDVECNSKVEDFKWLVVDGNELKGKYYWRKI